MSDAADKEWAEAYRRGAAVPWRARDDVSSPPLSEEFKAHMAYLDKLRASIPGPLVLRDEWEAAEWRKYSAYLDRLWAERARPRPNKVTKAMRIMEAARGRINHA